MVKNVAYSYVLNKSAGIGDVLSQKIDTYEELKHAIENYIDYYNNHHYQKRLNCMPPLEYRGYLGSVA
ncbi:IS3 family transposase [Acetobacterium tundrae]|uniref:IS3 family transposase n=1 Tax=Acetobacterium tundrae TaxID=132932 RepID=UPI003B75D124